MDAWQIFLQAKNIRLVIEILRSMIEKFQFSITSVKKFFTEKIFLLCIIFSPSAKVSKLRLQSEKFPAFGWIK